MDVGQLFGRSVALPVRVGADGRVAWSEGEDNVRDSIRAILLTEPGERLMLPDFGAGLRSFLFEPNTVSTRRAIADRIKRALTRWEPRIRLETVSVEEHQDQPSIAVVTLSYQLVATQTSERLDLQVQLARA